MSMEQRPDNLDTRFQDILAEHPELATPPVVPATPPAPTNAPANPGDNPVTQEANPQPLTPEQVEAERMTAWLGNAEFIKFLGQVSVENNISPDKLIKNPDKLEDYHVAFEKKESVTNEVVGFYRQELFEQLGLQDEVAKQEVEGLLKEHFDSLAIEHPERIGEFDQELTIFREQAARIQELEAQLPVLGNVAQLGREYQRLDAEERQKFAEHSTIQSNRESGNFLERSLKSAWHFMNQDLSFKFWKNDYIAFAKNELSTRKESRSEKQIGEIRARMEDALHRIESIDNIQREREILLGQIDDIKKQYIEMVDGGGKIKEILSKAIKEQIFSYKDQNSYDYEDVRAAEETFTHYQENQFVEEFTPQEQAKFDKQIKSEVREFIRFRVKDLVRDIGPTSLSQVDRFGQFLQENAKSDEEKDVIKKALKKAFKEQPQTVEGKIKGLYISVVLNRYFN